MRISGNDAGSSACQYQLQKFVIFWIPAIRYSFNRREDYAIPFDLFQCVLSFRLIKVLIQFFSV